VKIFGLPHMTVKEETTGACVYTET